MAKTLGGYFDLSDYEQIKFDELKGSTHELEGDELDNYVIFDRLTHANRSSGVQEIYFDGGGGFDTLDFEGAAGGSNKVHAINFSWHGEDGFDWFVNGGHIASANGFEFSGLKTYLTDVEAIDGTNRGDVFDLTGATKIITVHGDYGDDEITGSDLDDILYGGYGSDTIDGGAGNDYINAGPRGAGDRDVLYGGSGYDLFDVGGSEERIDGTTTAEAWRNWGEGEAARAGFSLTGTMALTALSISNPLAGAVLVTGSIALNILIASLRSDDPADITESADFASIEDFNIVEDQFFSNFKWQYDDYLYLEEASGGEYHVHLASDSQGIIAAIKLDDTLAEELAEMSNFSENEILTQMARQLVNASMRFETDEEGVARAWSTDKASSEYDDQLARSFADDLGMDNEEVLLLVGNGFMPQTLVATWDDSSGRKGLFASNSADLMFLYDPSEIINYDGVPDVKGTFFGFGGNDVMHGGKLGDEYFGGEGQDTVSFEHQRWHGHDALNVRGVIVDLSISGIQSVRKEGSVWYESDGDLFDSIENLIGSIYNDKLTGNGQDNELYGVAGNDILKGRSGNDTLVFSKPDAGETDKFTGGAGDDNYRIIGFSEGADPNNGATFNLEIYDAEQGEALQIDASGSGEDIENAEFDFQQIGGDTLLSFDIGGHGGSYQVTLFGLGTDQFQFRQTGYSEGEFWIGDVLSGTSADDAIVGTDGDDWITGSAGQDTIDGGSGHDTLDYSAWDSSIIVNPGFVTTQWITTTVTSIEEYFGTDKNDRMYGDSRSDIFHGGKGGDLLIGKGGADRLFGNQGDDEIYGGNGDDLLLGGTGDDELHGEDGDDTIHGGDGKDIIWFGSGNDTLSGGAGKDKFIFSWGEDVDAVTTITDVEAGELLVFEYEMPDDLQHPFAFLVSEAGDDVLISLNEIGMSHNIIIENMSLDQMTLTDNGDSFQYAFA